MVKMCLFFSSAVTKRFDYFNFSQLFCRDYARCVLKMLSNLEPVLELFKVDDIRNDEDDDLKHHNLPEFRQL